VASPLILANEFSAAGGNPVMHHMQYVRVHCPTGKITLAGGSLAVSKLFVAIL